MGIKSFYGQWVRKISSKGLDINLRSLPEIVISLFIDMNSIFHDAAGEVFLYSSKFKSMPKDKKERRLDELRKMTEDERTRLVAQKVIDRITELVTKINPREYLVLAVDGVAPMAKITQQRKRRFKKARDELYNTNDYPEVDEDTEVSKEMKNPQGIPFDSNCITPGTKFMQLLDFYIRYYLDESMKMRTNILPENVIYSSHLTPGEGEHKIFEMVRRGDIKPQGIGANVVVGMDADLIMLTLLSELPFLYLYREGYNKKGELETNVVNIDSLRTYIHNEFNIIEEDEAKKIDITITTRDFVTMIFFEGNDFLPHLVAFDDIAQSINLMISIYQGLHIPLTNEDGSMNWKHFGMFVKELAGQEQNLLKNMAKKEYEYPFTILDRSTKKTVLEIPEGTFGRELRMDKVKIDLNFETFQNLWYENALTPFTPKGVEFMREQSLPGVPFTQNGVLDMGYQYMIGLQWVLRYYQQGTKQVSSRFLYTYHHAPLIKDLGLIIDYLVGLGKAPTVDEIKFSFEDPKITAIHQLICVLPPPSWKFIPEPFRSLMTTRFADISPLDFKIEKEGIMKGEEWTAIPLLSIVDPVRIHRDLDDFDIPKQYTDRLPTFVKNIRRAFVPFKPQNLEQLRRIEERRLERSAEVFQEKKLPLSPLKTMEKKVASIKKKREEENFEVENKEFQKRNILIWKREELM